MATYLREERGAVPACCDLFAKQARRELRLRDEPGGVHRLFGKVRMLAGDALAPAAEALADDLNQQNAAAGGDAETGFERVGERQVDLAQVDGFNLHKTRV